MPFWEMILDVSMARSVFEFGCNAGWNLSAIRRVYSDVVTGGYDINENALNEAESAGLEVHSDLELCDRADLSFTAGVLIHIPPNKLEGTMINIVSKSYDWILAVEYDSPQEEEIEYHGLSRMLWKRDYGKLYQDLGLTLVTKGFATGFDDCAYWLFRK